MKIDKYFFLLYIFLLVCDNAIAQSQSASSIKLGATELTPTLQLIYFSDNNVFASESDEMDDKGYILAPTLSWRADKGLNSLTASYQGEMARHSELDEVDYSDHKLALEADLEFSIRSRLNLVARQLNEHEAPGGTGLSRRLDATVDGVTEYKDTEIAALYHYGARKAKGGLEFGLEYVERDYDNNPQVTDGYSFSRVKPTFTFLYAISPDTRLTTGIEYTAFNYEESDRIISLDNNNFFIFGGAVWEVTGKSGGSAKLGYGDRNFNSKNRKDDSSGILNLRAFWRPRDYSRISIDAQRYFSVDTGSPSIYSEILASWRHDWSGRVSTTLSYQWNDVNSDDNTDDQTITTLGFDVNVRVRRWAELTFSAKNSSSDAQIQDYEYDKQWLGVGLSLSL